MFALFLSNTFCALRACAVFRQCPLLWKVNHVPVFVFSKCYKSGCESQKKNAFTIGESNNLLTKFGGIRLDVHNGMSLHVTDVVCEILNSILALCEAERVFLFNIPLQILELFKVIVLLQKDWSKNGELNALEVLRKSTTESSKWKTRYDAF